MTLEEIAKVLKNLPPWCIKYCRMGYAGDDQYYVDPAGGGPFLTLPKGATLEELWTECEKLGMDLPRVDRIINPHPIPYEGSSIDELYIGKRRTLNEWLKGLYKEISELWELSSPDEQRALHQGIEKGIRAHFDSLS